MSAHNGEIRNVSDTTLWVAYFRALETKRTDALFRDPLAARLVGARGQKIAENMARASRYTQFHVVIRTIVIDRFIKRLFAEGVDTMVNLGAGLDTRPYRLALPRTARWVEADFPAMIAHKEQALHGEATQIPLTRTSVDLTQRKERRDFLAAAVARSELVAVLTEGVLPYLLPEDVDALSQDLLAQSQIRFWITDFISPHTYKYLRATLRTKKMANAPFRFYPPDWTGFFTERGWKVRALEYLPEEGLKLGRQPPAPWWAKLLVPFLPAAKKSEFLQSTGYMILERA